MASPATGKRVALAAVAGAHGVKGEVRLKLFADGVESLTRHSRLSVGGRELAL
ncbi:MAG TPA: 16S rRNA processing protein RimM, partial [Sphingomicrobium sp.]|nr:16S rRNA processing protein RimM [Sphingomicrobium sp.]